MAAEVALSALAPALSKLAGTAAAKAASFGFVRWRRQAHDTKVLTLADEKGPLYSLTDDALAAVGADVAPGLMLLLNSPDVADLCLTLSTIVLASGTGSAAALREESTHREQLLQTTRRYLLGVEPERVKLIAYALYGEIVTAVVTANGDLPSAVSRSPEATAALSRVAANMAKAAVRKTELARSAASVVEIAQFVRSLRQQIAAATATMRLPHAGTTRRVPYAALFVEPKIQPLATAEDTSAIDCVAALTSVPRLVVLGDPGGGKSTLSHKLTHDLARGVIDGLEDALPLLLILRDYAEFFKTEHQTLVSYFEATCRSAYHLEPPAGAVEHLLHTGQAVVVLDGLDELVDVSLRRKLVASVEAFAELYPSARILVTSRRVGYDAADLNPDAFAHGVVSPLDDEQVREYADKWFMLDDDLPTARRRELGKAFITDSQFVADLRRNPLMLSLMCGLYASEHYIPANRPEVYRRCAELLFEKWDKQRGIVTPLPFDAHVKLAVNALAYWMFTEGKPDTGLPRRELVLFFTKYLLEKRFDDDAEAENAANQFVDFCTGRSWVLTDLGASAHEELYGFTHQTFLEYFAANQLVRLNSSAEQLFAVLHDRIAAAEWDVVAQLALQILSGNVEDGGDDFLDMLLDAADGSPDEDRQKNLRRFAARSLSFVVPRPAIITRIAQSAVTARLAAIDSDQYGSILGCSEENFSLVMRETAAAVRAAVEEHSDDWSVLALACRIGLDTRGGSTIDARRDQRWADLRDAELLPLIAAALGRNAERDAGWSLQAALWGNGDISRTIRTWGIESLYIVHDVSLRFDYLHTFLLGDGLRVVARPPRMKETVRQLRSNLPLLWESQARIASADSLSIHIRTTTAAERPYWDADVAVALLIPVIASLSDERRTADSGRLRYYRSKGNQGADFFIALYDFVEAGESSPASGISLAALENMGISPETREHLLRWKATCSSS